MVSTNEATVRLPAAERRVQLIEVAKEVLSSQGFHDTTMSEIAKAAGVTKPVLYQHFESKRDLYTALLQETGDRLSEAIEIAVSNASGPEEQVRFGFGAYIRFVQDDPDGFRILFSGASRQDPEWAKIPEHVEATIADGIAVRMEQTDWSLTRRRILAHGLIGLAEGMMRQWHLNGADTFDLDEMSSDLQAVAWHGLVGIS